MRSDPVARFLAGRGAKHDRRVRLRPMSGGEILDMGLRVYQQLGWSFLRLGALPSVFCLAGLAFVGTYVLPSLFTTSNQESLTVQLGEAWWALLLGLLVGGPLFLIGVAAVTAAVTSLSSDYMVGNVPDVDAAWKKAMTTLPRLFLVVLRELLLSFSGILASVALMMAGGVLSTRTAETDASAGVVAMVGVCGLFLGFLVFLYVVAIHALAAPAAVLEDLGPRAAGKRSRELLRSHPFHGSGVGTLWLLYLLLGFIALILIGGFSASFGMLGVEEAVERFTDGFPFQGLFLVALDLLPWFLVIWTLVPMWAATSTIVYYERRIRLEGYDIEALAQDIARSDRASRFQL